MRAKKIVNQSSDFPVRRTGSYRHKKALMINILFTKLYVEKHNPGRKKLYNYTETASEFNKFRALHYQKFSTASSGEIGLNTPVTCTAIGPPDNLSTYGMHDLISDLVAFTH